VLKKTGIIVSVVAAGALGLGGIAFAHEAPHHDAPANITNTQSDNTSNDCDFGQAGPLVDQDLTGGDGGLAGVANPVTGLVAPITAQTQAANCLNVVSRTEDNTDSNNTTSTDSRSRVDHSFNNTTAPADNGPFGPGFPFN
jgi:hypothetical protein